MVIAELVISGWNWLLPAMALFAGTTAIALWAYQQHPVRQVRDGSTFAALALRIVGLLILAVCLLEPMWTGESAKQGANIFAVLADNSKGMMVEDADSKSSRAEQLRQLLDPDSNIDTPWMKDLENEFQVRRYLFDDRVQRTVDFSELDFAGNASAIGGSLRTVVDRYRGRPLAGMLLLTDGIATDLVHSEAVLADLPPIYPVVIGGNQTKPDVALSNVTVTQTSFEDSPVTIRAEVNATGFAGREVVVELINEDGEGEQGQIHTFVSNDEGHAFRFKLRPDEFGPTFYRVEVTLNDDDGTEATLSNNAHRVVVDRGEGPFRVLYVSGRPNWEYKFLRRGVEGDSQLDMVGLIRVADKEPKFSFRGRQGEDSNPLFRGFSKNNEEDTERFDEAVMVRLNTKDEHELKEGFPKNESTLFGFHAVIVDDLESEFFTQDQMTLLHRFVSERGGGFLMLGGRGSFGNGEYDRTRIGQMLPVYLDRMPPPDRNVAKRLTLTREGWLQPWARLRQTEDEERSRLQQMPEFQVLNRVSAIKPGASIIASIGGNGGTQYPGLVVQRYGHGRTAALTVGDVWRWGFRNEELQKDMAKSWRQLLRWLVADVPDPISMMVEKKEHQVNQPVLMQVRARDDEFRPMSHVNVTVKVTDGDEDGDPINLVCEPSLDEAGLYEATFIPRSSGQFRAVATVQDEKGVKQGNAEVGWVSDLEAAEFRSIKTDHAALERIAKLTGGEVVQVKDLSEFVRTLPQRHAPIKATWTRPIWHVPVVFLVALACFVGEWALRRRRGLA